MDFEFNFAGGASGQPKQHKPFNLLILGNFGGQLSTVAGNEDSGRAHRIVKTDLDNIDELWKLFTPRLSLQAGSVAIEIAPSDIDDFHPDELFRNLPVFEELRGVRRKLRDPATAGPALDEILAARTVIEGEVLEASESPAEAGQKEEAGAMFERLLGKSEAPSGASPRASRDSDRLDSFIHSLVAPHIVHDPDPRVETAVDSVDLATAETMRRILHHPEFQALENSWRALFDLVSELELDENLNLYVCDIRKEDLLGMLPDPGVSLQDSALFQLLVHGRRQAADDTPWTTIVGDYYFGPGPEDIALLTGLGAVAAVNGGVFLGGARPEMLGCTSTAELADARYWSSAEEANPLWQSLRTSPVADHVGLALPRVLARLPYGRDTEEIDSFQFEEMPSRNHEDYLWSNPAFACGRLLAQDFTREGWQMRAGDHVDLGFLPAHHYTEDGEARLQPCAELLLSESTMVSMLEQGLMPLVSYRNQNTAVLGRFQSIASPLKPLAGPWLSG